MKTRKIIISLVLALILTAVISVVALAAPTIEVSSAGSVQGQTVNVTVSLVDNPGIVMAALNVAYDTDFVELIGVQDAGALGIAMHLLPSPSAPGANPYILSWNNSTAPSNFTYSGVIATLKFRIKAEAELNTPSPITVTYIPANIVDYDLQPVFFAVSNGSVTALEGIPQTITLADIPEKTYGDAAFDLSVTPDAVSGLADFQYSSSNEAVATVDADGKVTIVGAGIAEITAAEPGNDLYLAASSTKTLVVEEKEITIVDVVASKVYDGNANVTLSGGQLVGVLGGDDVSFLLPMNASFENAEPGVGKAVILDSIILTGADAGNYTLIQPVVKGDILVLVESIALDDASEMIVVGEQFTLNATVFPANATNKDIKWTSSAPAVASVEGGVVTALSAGTATITATTVDGAKTATCVIKVYASYEDMPSIVAGNARATAGNIVNVPITIKNNPGFVSALILVDYDSTVLELVEVVDGEILGSAIHSDNKALDPYKLYWANPTELQNIIASGTAATLKFRIKDGAETGVYPVKISYDMDMHGIIDVNFNDVELRCIDGFTEVIDFVYGDVDGDTYVTNIDSAKLARYLAGWQGYDATTINLDAADVDCDGFVTNIDSAILARHLAGWVGYGVLPKQ